MFLSQMNKQIFLIVSAARIIGEGEVFFESQDLR